MIRAPDAVLEAALAARSSHDGQTPPDLTTSGRRAAPDADRPLRFCLITTFYPPYNFGGDGIFVQRQANELARRGHHVEVIHSVDAYRALARCEPVDPVGDHPSVRVHRLRAPFGAASALATHQVGLPVVHARRIQAILSAGFDVIHYHNISLVGGPRILQYGRGLKLYTMHEYWLVCPTNLLLRFKREPCERKRCFACTLSYGRPPQLWRHSGLLPNALRHVDAFIAGTRFTLAAHAQRGLDVPMVHLPFFVPVPSKQPPALGSSQPDEPYFLLAGRLEELKGVQTLIPVFRRYRKAKLLIAGAGAYEQTLRRMAADCPNVVFLGQLSERALEPLYHGAVALIVPSLMFEVSPMVVLESFANRTPVIARDIGALAELVQESGGGLLYSSDEELVAAMESLINDAVYTRELADRAHRSYKEKWSPDVHFDRYFALIRDLSVAGHARLAQPVG